MFSTIAIDEILEEFEFLGDWEEQCRYLIELGSSLPDLEPHEKIEENRVHGCMSRVWFIPSLHEEQGQKRIFIRAKSDARIVDGLICVLLAMCNGRTPEEILETDFRGIFQKLGLETHLVPQRRNGLFSMLGRILAIAQHARDGSLATAAGQETPSELAHDATGPQPATGSQPAAGTPTGLPVDKDQAAHHRPLDVHAVRADFPILNEKLPSGLPIIFLDTAASAQKPQVVIDRESEVYQHYYANAYRGVYQFGDRVSRELEISREKVQRFIGAQHSEEIIFTSGTTMSINLVAHAWGRKFLREGDEILLTEMEHHANLVPWQIVAQETGAVLRFIPLAADGQLDLSRLDEVVSPRTAMAAITAMSNVLGTVPPLAEIRRKVKEVGALLLVDGAQSVPHLPTNVVSQGIDFLAFSGHKLYGPSGVGVLYGRRELLDAMNPFLAGGHMVARVFRDHAEYAPLPAKFEAGTLPIAQAIALGTAVDYVAGLGLCSIHEYEQNLLRYAQQRMAEVPGLRILGPSPEHKGAIISFVMEGAAAQDIAQLLDLRGLCVRHGHHCTMPLHDQLCIPASVRASFGIYNTRDDADALVEGLHYVRQQLKL